MSDQDSSHEQDKTTLTKEVVKTMADKTVKNVFKEVLGESTDNKKVGGGGNTAGAPLFQEMERVGLVNVETMDDNNKKAYDVLKNKGTDAAVKFMFKHPYEKDPVTGEGRAMSYSEMRSFYG